LSLSDARIVDLPKIADPRGNLTFIQHGGPVPFDLERVYYLYDVPGGADRGGHAHVKLEQFIIAASGSFDVVLREDGDPIRFTLRRANYGLYVPTMVWRVLENFSSGSVCLVLASDPFDESDYYRDYSTYVDALRSRSS